MTRLEQEERINEIFYGIADCIKTIETCYKCIKPPENESENKRILISMKSAIEDALRLYYEKESVEIESVDD